VRPLWSRKGLILALVLLATLLTYGFSARQPDVYTSGTLVYVKDPGDPVSGAPSPQSTDRAVQNQASLLYSLDTATTVAGKIDYPGTPDDLLRHVTVTSRAGEDFVSVTAKAPTGRESAVIANAFAAEFAGLINDAFRTRIDEALRFSRRQLAQLPRSALKQIAGQNLSDQVARLEVTRQVPPTIAQQVDPAVVPSSPSSPKPVRNAIGALILSLVLAIGLAFALERFDRRLKRPEEVEELYGAPLLAVLPHTGDPAAAPAHGEVTLGAAFREPFRVLRTNIELATLDAPARTIVVSSALPGEGKSTVVRNLALAFREAGRRVAVVEGDLRELAPLFGSSVGPGLTEVLRHDATLDEVTVQIGSAIPAFDELVRIDGRHAVEPGRNGGNGTNGHGAAVAGTGALTLLQRGARPSNPPAVLASDRVREVLDELRATYDVVLIDSAPLLTVTDTVPLLRYADAAIFVSRLGATTRETAKRLVEVLARVPDVHLLGVVANDLSRLEAAGYGYSQVLGGRRDDAPPSLRRRTPPWNLEPPRNRV
jgi:Mrp family chromosome partitioning ATPase/capsular polysaccharide biosynthesis protein